MSGPPRRTFSEADTISAAAAAIGQGTEIALVERLDDEQRRNFVLRAKATDAAGERPIFIKATKYEYDPASPDIFGLGTVKEWAATALLAERAPDRGHGARLIASDMDRGVLVFEDLGASLGTLVGPLLGDVTTDAEDGLTAHAAALACLHADTHGCLEAHRALLIARFPQANLPVMAHTGWFREVSPKLAAALGTDLPADETDLLLRRLTDPGAWLGLVHCDACPDNTLIASSEARLLDYEFARPGHVLLDIAYARMGFMTCWCAGRTPSPIVERVERAYRVSLSAANDAAFDHELAIICAASMIIAVGFSVERALREETRWGISNNRSRILWYLEAAIEAMRTADTLPKLRGMAATWLDRLRESWPESKPLPLYPAFGGPPIASR